MGGDLGRLAPQLNFFHEMGQPWREVQDRLSRARVSVLGLGAPGAVVAAGLAAAGVGSLRLIDDLPVREEDRLHAPMFARADTVACWVGTRYYALLDAIEWRSSPETAVEVRDTAIDSDEAMLAVTEGSDLVACCVDFGRSAHRHRLNRVCDAQRGPLDLVRVGRVRRLSSARSYGLATPRATFATPCVLWPPRAIRRRSSACSSSWTPGALTTATVVASFSAFSVALMAEPSWAWRASRP